MALKAIAPNDGMQVGLCFANNPNNVADVHITYTDGSFTSGWYASNISLSGTGADITMTSRPEAGPRPSMKLDLARVAHILIQLSDGRDVEFGTKPVDAPTDAQLAVANLANHGEALRQQGKLQEAEIALTKALEGARQVFAPDDANLPRAISSLATLYFDRADYPRAHALYREALDLYRAQSQSSIDLADMLNSLGLVELRMGNLPTAQRVFLQAIEIYRSLGAARSRGAARALHNLAVSHGQAGDFAAAGPLFHEALEMRRALFGENHPETVESLASFGTFWLVQKDIAQAEPLFRRALELTRQALGVDHLTTAERSMDVALCIKQKRTLEAAEEAEPLLRLAYVVRLKHLGDAHPSTQFAYKEMSAVQRALGIS